MNVQILHSDKPFSLTTLIDSGSASNFLRISKISSVKARFPTTQVLLLCHWPPPRHWTESLNQAIQHLKKVFILFYPNTSGPGKPFCCSGRSVRDRNQSNIVPACRKPTEIVLHFFKETIPHNHDVCNRELLAVTLALEEYDIGTSDIYKKHMFMIYKSKYSSPINFIHIFFTFSHLHFSDKFLNWPNTKLFLHAKKLVDIS